MTFMFTKNIAAALHTMKSNRGRSFLTMLGIIVAVASVTTVISIGNGIHDSLDVQANQYSQNVITVRPKRIGVGGPLAALSSGTPAAAITDQDVNDISRIKKVAAAVPLTTVGSAAKADSSASAVIFAASSDLPSVLNQELAYGAFFTENESSNNVAVLGASAADKLFDQKVPLGRSFTVRNQQFIVSGVLTQFDSTPFVSGTNYNDAIFVPTSAIKTLTPAGAPMYEVLVKVKSASDVAVVDQNIGRALAKNHTSQNDFEVLSPSEQAGDSTVTFKLLTQLVTAAAIIIMLVSGIGIMNVMLVSVTERIHEIGIRKAVGATNRQILGQFTTEAATLCVVGSIIGALVALVAVYLLRAFTNLAPQYNIKVAVLACVVACAFGIIFGALPAIKAARKDPIDALRSE